MIINLKTVILGLALFFNFSYGNGYPSTCQTPPANKRVDCLKFNSGDCVKSGCCWSPISGGAFCFYPTLLLGCINDDSSNLQLSASGYHVKSIISCVSACNSYSPPIFSDAFFLEDQLCFCRNASLPNLYLSRTNTCVTSTCLKDNSTFDCTLSNFAFVSLSLGIIEWNITFNPTVAFVDKEVQINTKILRGNASNAFVVPLSYGLPLSFLNYGNNTTIKTQFYLPGIKKWSQTIGNSFADPFNATSWLQVDERIGGIYVIPTTVQLNGSYNFFLVITKGTNISVNISLPMNNILNFTADILRLSYGFNVSLLNSISNTICTLSDGYVLKQAILTSGRFTKLMVKVYAKGLLEIAILRPSFDSSKECPFGLECPTTILSNSVTISAIVVKKVIFLLNATGVVEIPIQSSTNDVRVNDMVWVGGNASLFCTETSYEKVQGEKIGNTIVFSTNQMSNGIFISLFITKSFEYLIPIPASTIGLFNFTVNVSSHVSLFQKYSYSFPIQRPVSGLKFGIKTPVPKSDAGYIINRNILLNAIIDNGPDVRYLFDIPGLNYSMNTSSTTATFRMIRLGGFTVYLTAANKFNSLNTSINIEVLSEINSIKLDAQDVQLEGISYVINVSIFNGNKVQLKLDFGDGTNVIYVPNIDATGGGGGGGGSNGVFMYSTSHTFSKCNLNGYNVTAQAVNVLFDGNAIVKSPKSTYKIIKVFCKMSSLNIVPTPVVSQNGYVLLSPNKYILVTISQDTGSYRNYLIDWGDGSFSPINQTKNVGLVSFQVQHLYSNQVTYIISVICKNYLESKNNSITVVVRNCTAPGVSFYYGSIVSPLSIIQSAGVDLIAVVANTDPVCLKLDPLIKWSLSSSASNNPKEGVGIQVQQKVTYTIKKNELKIGLYTLTLFYTYGVITNTYTAYLNVTNSPLFMFIDKGFFNSIAYRKKNGNESLHQNFTISASSSYDPDNPTIGIQDIYFNWRCKVFSNFSDAEVVKANLSNLKLNYTGDTCYNQTWVNISSGNAKINFSTQQFLEGINYHIEVCGTKYAGKDVELHDIYKTNCFIQVLLIVPQDIPTLSVICVSNCDEKLNFKERVIYTYECEECIPKTLRAKWDIADDDGRFPPEFFAENATTTGFDTPSLVVNKDILLESKNYTFILDIGFIDSVKRTKFKFTKSTCSKPTPGVCFANPPEGYALETKFNIVCNDWKDSDGLLRYMFYYDNGQINHMNVSSSTTIDYPILNAATTDKPSLIDFLMGPGDKNNGDKTKIIIKVTNKYKAYTEYKNLYIQVHPNKNEVNMTDLIAGINLKDTQSLANLVQAVSSSTNKMSANYSNSTLPIADNIDNDISIQQKQKQLALLQESRTHMIGLLSNATINDLSSFKTIGDALALTSQNPTELVPQSQRKASDIVAKMSGLLTSKNLEGIGADSFDTMTQPFLKSISNLFQTSLTSNESDSVSPTFQTTTSSTTKPPNIEKNSQMVLKLFKSMDQHFIAAQSYKVPGENATVGETSQFTFVLKKEFSSSLSNKSIGSSDGDYGFTLPDSKDLFNDSVQNSRILVNNMRMKDNVYTWDTNRSQNILSESQSLSFSDSNGLPIKVTNISQPIIIAIKNIPEKMTGQNITLSMPNDVNLVRLPLTPGCNMLLKFKTNENNLTTLIVYIQYGKIATKNDYDIMLNISAKNGVVMTKNNNVTAVNVTLANSVNNVTQNQINFSGIVQRNQDARLTDEGTLLLWNFLNSTYGFYNISILHLLFSYSGPMPPKKLDLNPYTFDEAENPGTYNYEMKSFCAECNYWNENENKWMSDGCELDVNSTTFLVTKCKCTHLTAFGGFFVAPNPIKKPTLASLKSGYVLLVTVAIVLTLWIVGLIFSRRMDKKDVSKVGVCPLLDNRDGDSYMYQIIVNTGNRKNAGTKSNIFFVVAGEISDSAVRRLKDSERKCFQRSSCDMFIMTTDSSLGDLDYIRLWHDNSGGGWYLKNITIIDLHTEKQFLFMGNRWLAVDRDFIDCVIPVASVEEQNDFNYVFASKAKRNLSDEHLWFSIFARPPKSNFTRCQRLSVAVSLLLTSMMVSTMFYGKVEAKQDPKTENKSVFTFTKTQILVVLISTFIKFPVHLFFIKLFRSIRPFEKSNNKNDNLYDKSGGWQSPTHSAKRDSVSSNEKTTQVVLEKNVSLKKKKKYLSHCFLYVAWFVCVVNILGCGAIVLLYGMTFGNKTSLNWLATVTIDLVKEIFFTEPIKIFILAIFFAIFIKKIQEEETEFETQGKTLALDENWLHKPKYEPSIFDRTDIEWQPPDSSKLSQMRELRLKNLKMYALTQEFAIYIFYAVLVMFLGYKTRENIAFYQTRNVQDLFNLTLRGVPWPRDYSQVFNQIQASQDFWNWMDGFFLPQVFPEPWYNLSDLYSNTDIKNFPGKLFLNDLNSKIVNGIRIRQVRVQPNSCVKAKLFAQFFKIDCMSPYNPTLEETRGFFPNWTVPSVFNSAINPLTKPWKYQTWQELDGYPYAAGLETYYGGGYVVEIFPKWDNKDIIDKVKNLRWIDRQTRAILIEFALFNPATSYFTMVTMVLEFPASGGVIPTFSVLTFSLYTSVTGSKAMLFSNIFFILMTILFTIRECRFLYRTGCKYFIEFWNLVEVALILFSLIAVGLFFYKDHLAKVLLQRMPAKKPQTFINFQFASYWDLTYVYIVSLIVFFVTLKFIKLLRFNRRVSLLSSTLKAAWYPLSMFFIMFFIIICSTVTTSHIVFGSSLDGYQNYFKAISSIISLLLGKFSYSHFESANGVLGPIFFFGFNVMVNWIVMNIFMTILNDAFADVCEELHFQENEYEMVDFIVGHFKEWLGWNSPKKETENLLTNKSLSTNESDQNNDCQSVTYLENATLNKSQNITKVNDHAFIYENKSNLDKVQLQVSKKVSEEGIARMFKEGIASFKEVNENLQPVELDDEVSDRISELSKYDYLFKKRELDICESESLGMFINCMNVIYKANETLERNKVIEKKFKKKAYENSNFVIISSKNFESS